VENQVIDLTGDDWDDVDPVMLVEQVYPGSSKVQDTREESSDTRSHSTAGPSHRSTSSKRSERPIPKTGPKAKQKASEPTSQDWACLVCTLLNGASALQCEACLSERPLDRTSTWACAYCGESGMNPEFWTCRFCGAMKLRS
jgi:hypothetical protein